MGWITRHETCQQYVARRLSEGWRIASQRGYYLVLSSPDGNILRPVDLRNDVETLRPNAAGDETSIPYQYPDAGAHYAKVNEVVADEDDTLVKTFGAVLYRDLYNLPASSGSGTINFIKVYIRGKTDLAYQGFAYPSLKSNSTVTDGGYMELTTDWVTRSQQWNTNPAGGDWEWSDIDTLQIGLRLRGNGAYYGYCTQVYVEIDYTPVVVEAPTVTTQDADGIGFD